MEKKQPGDLILDVLMPDATPAAREEARESLQDYGILLLRIGRRLAGAKGGEDAPTREGRHTQ